MDLDPRGYEKVLRLIEKGVAIPNPHSLDIGDDVDTEHISGRAVVLYPGCRVYGEKTVISAGVKLGAEGPATVDNCRLGPDVELKGGYFKQSVFLEKASVGAGAQIREGCLLEEWSSVAHCVGLKQTILFPFVTLGSLVNFCDCLMAGGTSRAQHSEVGSSYIHFNYTPDGDKATGSLFGDVPRGVMVNQPPIFLGGQGGAVGPVRVGYGTVVAAGSILRHDVAEDGKFVFAAPPRSFQRDHRRHAYENLRRVVINNVAYLANVVALEEWYKSVRAAFFARQEMGDLMCAGALEILALAKDERLQRLAATAQKVPDNHRVGREMREREADIRALFDKSPSAGDEENFMDSLDATLQAGGDYITTIQGLAPELSAKGTRWLQAIVDALTREVHALIPSLGLAGTRR